MKAMGQVRLPTLRNAIMSHSLSQEWFATSDKNMLTLSLRPREEQLVPHLAMQKPATRLASHLCITRRGVVVLVNCDLEECKEPLALAVAHASPLEVESGPAMSSAATAATAFETAQAPSGGVQRVLRMLGVGPRPPPAPSSSPLPVMPFEGPAAVSNMELRRISDYMTVEVRRSLEGWCALEEGTLVVKRLDLESVRVIAGALEQSILLQVYEGGADRLHAEAAWLNERVREQRLDAIGRKRLYRVLASNSAVTDAVMGTGVQSMRLPGSAAWMDTRYEDLLAAMSDELELPTRAAEVVERLGHVSELVKFCLHEKGETAIERLEVQIVLILTVELAISAVELYHGHGGAFVRGLWELLAGEASTLADVAGQRH
ncbi:hypothetical protein FNF31_03582 [Cafeteria roenbergensis]|nr:hypothetical protein FNF31_03582 [Cafeteria roenbergensis]